jgi:MoxR-like ATPase
LSYVAPQPYEDLTTLRDRARIEIAKVVVGQDRAVDLLLVAALAQGHVLIEGPPGSATTLLGRGPQTVQLVDDRAKTVRNGY